MKYIIAVLAAAITALATSTALAYNGGDMENLPVSDTNNVNTVITDTEGDTHTINGALLTPNNKIESYQIIADGELILTVTPNMPEDEDYSLSAQTETNVYYSVEFDLSSEENTAVYLSGLTAANKDEVQKKLLNAHYANKELSIESFDFVDAEKAKSGVQEDDNLCWAASTSDVLWYTGWAKKAGFESEDAVFDVFMEAFTDTPGNQTFGYDWFFNGLNLVQKGDGFSKVRDYGNSGAYLNDYSSTILKKYINTQYDRTKFREITEFMRKGWGIGMVIGWYDESKRNGGHCITMWGYIYDKSYEQEKNDNINNIKAIIISDSDSDRLYSNRRLSPNKFSVLHTHPYQKYGWDTWILDTYASKDGVIEAFMPLMPYSDSIPKETNNNAGKNCLEQNDFIIDEVELQSNGITFSKFAEGEPIEVVPQIGNFSAVDFEGTISYKLTIGQETYNASYNEKIEGGEVKPTQSITLNNLKKGEYDCTLTIENTNPEAYYYNNSYDFKISVGERQTAFSEAKVSVTMPDYIKDHEVLNLQYTDTDNLNEYIDQNTDCEMYISYYDSEDDKWLDWNKADSKYTGEENPYSGHELPKSLVIYSGSPKMRFCVVVKKPGEIPVKIYSDEYNIKYNSLSVVVDDTNSNKYTNLESGVNALADNEVFAFRLCNDSNYDSGEIGTDVYLRAINRVSNDIVTLYSEDNVTLPYNGYSKLITVKDWDKDKKLSGTYSIEVALMGDYRGTSRSLGTLCVKEKPSLIVDTDKDVVNEYDGLTSLREAVAVCGENDTIKIDEDVSELVLNDKIEINKKVSIDFMSYTEPKYGATSVPTGVFIYSAEKNGAFSVTKNGSLSIKGVTIAHFKTTERGGAILIDGGDVDLYQCRIFNCNGAGAGGGICLNSGSLKANSCVFEKNEAGYGGAIAVLGGRADLVNCSAFINSSNSGAIYAGGGDVNIINSTIANNTVRSEGGTAITASAGNVNVIGSIAVGGSAIDGRMNVYASYVEGTDDDAEFFDCTFGTQNGMFLIDKDNDAVWKSDYIYNRAGVIQLLPTLSSEAEKGYDINVTEDGKISYTKDGVTKTTSVVSPFSSSVYKMDIIENNKSHTFGNYQTTYNAYEKELSADGKAALIYTYNGADANVIVAEYNNDGTLNKVKSDKAALKSGTNTVELYDKFDTDNTVVMLWNGIDTLTPIVSANKE